IPTGGIGSGEHELFDEDGEVVGQVWATSLKYTRTIETSLGASYPTSDTGAGFANVSSLISEFRINNAGDAAERHEINAVSVNDTVLVRSTTNKGRWFVARVDSVLRSSAEDGISIRYNHSEAKTNTTDTEYSTMESYLGGDSVEITFFNDHATGRYLHDEARICVGNSSSVNLAKVQLNGNYHFGTVNNIYPLNIGTIDNYHGDLSNTRRSMAFTTQSSLQGFVWRYSTMSASYQAGMSLRSDGRLNVAYGIKVGGGISDTGNVSSTYRLYVSGQIYSTSNISAYSDKRAKENIKPITDGLDKILKLEGVYYNMKEGHSPNEDHTRPRVGVLAQDVQKILPEVVTYAEEEDMYSVDYGNITAVLIEAIKDQQKIIESLSERISGLEKR
ncbi:tail fiber domain-containing protein, partial [Porticoccaceae bacterium]|nr:tail fiber domain-containing protein [Porticoccaceae bacterium]